MENLFQIQSLIALLTLTALEIVLGVDNIVFISILTGKLKKDQQSRGRTIGLSLAMLTRLLLLLSIKWVVGLTQPFFTFRNYALSGRDLILILGGLFLLTKSTLEIHERLEGEGHAASSNKKAAKFGAVIFQIMLLDVVFSLDSVITAVGMSNQIVVMCAAVVISVGFMLVFSGHISRFVHDHPTVKMLALSFLLLIGFTLVADGLHHHVSKGTIYFAMAFSVFVEMLNLRIRASKTPPVELRQPQL